MTERIYTYVVLDPEGKEIRGTILAAGEEDAEKRLLSQGLYPLSVFPGPEPAAISKVRAVEHKGFHLDKALILVIAYTMIIAWAGHRIAMPYWKNRQWTEALATRGVQCEATVLARESAEEKISRGRGVRPKVNEWHFYRYVFKAPDDLTYRGILTERSDFFSIPGGIFPVSRMDRAPGVGETFTVTWVGGDTPVFMPGHVGPPEFNKANRRFMIIVCIFLLLGAVSWGLYWNYSRMGWVSRLFRPITQSPSRPDELFIRSQHIQGQWSGLIFFNLSLVTAASVLLQMETFRGYDRANLYGLFAFLMLCIGVNIFCWSLGWTRINRNKNILFVKQGSPFANPFKSALVYPLGRFNTVRMFNDQPVRRGGRHGSKRAYIAGVSLSGTNGDVRVFVCERKRKAADPIAWDVAENISRFLGIPIRDTTKQLHAEGMLSDRAPDIPGQETSPV